MPVRLVGVPWDATTLGRKGSRLAPDAIRRELGRLHPYDAREGKPVSWLAGRDLTLSEEHSDLLRSVARAAEQEERIDPEAPLVLLGGDHAVAYAGAMACRRRFPHLQVVSVDAHLDLRGTDQGPSNGNWATRWLTETHAPYTVLGVGRFANDAELFERARKENVRWVGAWTIREQGVPAALKPELDRVRGKDIYLSVDVDSVDQSSAPGASSPAVEGLSVVEAVAIVRALRGTARVRGFDLCEVNPTVDPAGITPRLAAHLLLSFLAEGDPSLEGTRSGPPASGS